MASNRPSLSAPTYGSLTGNINWSRGIGEQLAQTATTATTTPTTTTTAAPTTATSNFGGGGGGASSPGPFLSIIAQR
jgi:hypothetical protein